MPTPLAAVLRRFVERVARDEIAPECSEAMLYPAVCELVEEAARALGVGGVAVKQLPIGAGVGDCRPDLQVLRGAGEVVGYIEVKWRPREPLAQIGESGQLRSYRESFPTVLLTDLHELLLWRNGERAGAAVVRGPEDPVRELFDRFFASRSPRHRTARALAIDLARRARFLRREIELLLGHAQATEAERRLRTFFEASRRYLIENQTEAEFAALYAETLTYGLFAARAWSPEPDEGFDDLQAFERIPKSLGVLRDLFRFITAADTPKEIRWILDDLVEVLRAADMRRLLAVRAGGRTADDPVYHFYETFLREYDPETRRRRGVYYTPQAVVSYIVRSAAAILDRDFGKPLGFADEGVAVLDPAAGTLAFLAEAARVAIRNWPYADDDGKPALIRDRLLPGLHGVELLMAPYVIGHLRLARLYERHGHRLADGERVRLYLANALRGREPEQGELPLVQLLADEAHEAWRVERELPIAVVLGNPPYRGHSANRRREGTARGEPPWIERLLKEGLPIRDGRLDHGYYRAGGRPLGERNPKWLQNDYVKFLRLAQWIVHRQGSGIVGFVTDRGWLEHPTFRGMRESLLGTFDTLYLLDLHGEVRQAIRTGEHPGDENVFPEIQQGVAVALLVKTPRRRREVRAVGCDPPPRAPREDGDRSRVYYHERLGGRREKLRWLDAHDVGTTAWRRLRPEPPGWFLDTTGAPSARYRGYPALDEIFPVHSAGMITARDRLVTDRSESELKARIGRLAAFSSIGPEDAADWRARNTRTWRIDTAWKRLRADERWPARFHRYLYRPFQTRWVFYADYMVERPRREVMRHLLLDGNLGLIAPKQAKEEPGALITDRIAGHKAFSAFDVSYVFPLHLEGGPLDDRQRPNVEPKLLAGLRRRYGATIRPIQILAYVYAALHSRGYRERHADALRRGFPRIPFPRDPELFRRLDDLGQRLIDLHLLAPAAVDGPRARFEGGVRGADAGGAPAAGGRPITTRRYDPVGRRVTVNAHGDAFAGVSPEAWAYRIGGYRVLDRWLADAAGEAASADGIECFCRTVAALERTLELEPEIDRLVGEVEEEEGEGDRVGRAVAAL